MTGKPPSEITRLLQEAAGGDAAAAERLWSLVYGELRRVARRHLANERPGHTLQTTALVNEAYLRLTGGSDVAWSGRAHFFAAAAEAMRRILIDRARRRRTEKRGGGLERVTLDEARVGHPSAPEELLALDEALERLEARDPRRAQVVKLRFFAGCTEQEIARVLGLSERSVSRLWTGARAWLYDQMATRSGA